MLIKAKALNGYKLNSLDGEIGKVKEFFFDDKHWAIRYLIVDAGGWLIGRQVLISPYALSEVNQEEHHIDVRLTKKQIEESPTLDTDRPVSRQFEDSYYGYYGWNPYWGGPSIWGSNSYPYTGGDYANVMGDRMRATEPSRVEKASWDHHLRSTHDVTGYNIQATDGDIGHIQDFIIDDVSWAIRYLIVDTRNWWPGKKVLVSTKWIDRVSWNESKVFVKLSLEAVRQSPEYTEESLITRDYEEGLHRHYKREGYWADEPAAKEYIF